MVDFYPRPPCGGRPSHLLILHTLRSVFLSTSPLRGTTLLLDDWRERNDISIHVPLAGDDSVTDIDEG